MLKQITRSPAELTTLDLPISNPNKSHFSGGIGWPLRFRQFPAVFKPMMTSRNGRNQPSPFSFRIRHPASKVIIVSVAFSASVITALYLEDQHLVFRITTPGQYPNSSASVSTCQIFKYRRKCWHQKHGIAEGTCRRASPGHLQRSLNRISFLAIVFTCASASRNLTTRQHRSSSSSSANANKSNIIQCHNTKPTHPKRHRAVVFLA